MSALHGLLERDPVVAAAGIDVLADAVAAQGASVTRVAWQPPVPGTEAALAALAANPAKPDADAAALAALTGTRPHLVTVAPAGELLPELTDGLLLHAGPPIAWDDCSGPLRGALIGACSTKAGPALPKRPSASAARSPSTPATTTTPPGPWPAWCRRRCRSPWSRTRLPGSGPTRR